MWIGNKINCVLATIYFISAPSSAVAKMCKSTELFNKWIKASKFAERQKT